MHAQPRAYTGCMRADEARQVIFQSGALPILLQHMRHVDPDVQVVSLRSVAMLSHDEVCANELCKIDVVSTMAHLSVSPHLGVQHMTAVVAANCIRGGAFCGVTACWPTCALTRLRRHGAAAAPAQQPAARPHPTARLARAGAASSCVRRDREQRQPVYVLRAGAGDAWRSRPGDRDGSIGGTARGCASRRPASAARAAAEREPERR